MNNIIRFSITNQNISLFTDDYRYNRHLIEHMIGFELETKPNIVLNVAINQERIVHIPELIVSHKCTHSIITVWVYREEFYKTQRIKLKHPKDIDINLNFLAKN